jgi:protein tyrosine phosphatase
LNEDNQGKNHQSNMLPNPPPQHLKPTQVVPPAPQLQHLIRADIIPPTTTFLDYQNLINNGHQVSHNTGSNNGLENKKTNLDSNGEPIYQNQAELMQQMIAAANKDSSKEPIYQNLPAHEKLFLEEQKQKHEQNFYSDHDKLPAGAITPESQSQSEPTTNSDITNVEQTPDIQSHLQERHISSETNSTIKQQNKIGVDISMEKETNDKTISTSINSKKIRGHVSRVAITNSRENLSQHSSCTDINSENGGSGVNYHTEFSEFVHGVQGYDKHKHRSHGRLSKTGEHKKSVTKINIIPSEQDEFEETIKAYKSELISTSDVVGSKEELNDSSLPKEKMVKTPKSKVNPIKKPERRRSTPAASTNASPEKEGTTTKDNLSKTKTSSSGIGEETKSYGMQTSDKKKGSALMDVAIKQQNVMNHNVQYLSNEHSSRKALSTSSTPSSYEKLSNNVVGTKNNNKSNNNITKHKEVHPEPTSSNHTRPDSYPHNFAQAKNSVDLIGKNFMPYHNHHSNSSGGSDNTPRTPAPKPRGVRRKWGFHFGGSKSGSLKSIKSTKSEDGSTGNDAEDGGKKSHGDSKFGPMMLATLHGLTRSRPDLLTESLATFSAFTTPARMPKDEIGAHLEAKLAEGEVLREFERIPKRKLEQESSQSRSMFRTACLAENVSRNRFKDVLPYEENRVRLSLPTDKDNKTGYINASHVSATVGDQQRFYIAAQGPLPNTVIHFWQMVLQSDVHLIVMLTDSSVGDKGGISSNCLPYWPQKNGSTLDVGDFRIYKQFTSLSSNGAYTTSTLTLSHAPTGSTRTIWHLQYTDWGDTGCPTDVRSYLDFLEEMSSLRTHIATSSEVTSNRSTYRNRNPPVLIHCSAGVGRTGITVLCDILLYCVNYNIDIDIPKMLTHLRQQRMLMVQTIAQYKFVHTVLINYLKQSRLI